MIDTGYVADEQNDHLENEVRCHAVKHGCFYVILGTLAYWGTFSTNFGIDPLLSLELRETESNGCWNVQDLHGPRILVEVRESVPPYFVNALIAINTVLNAYILDYC